MALSKTDQITALALEILEDAEMSRTSVESMVLKTSRLARLVDDEETLQWLWHERHGYNDSTELSLKYLGITSRWIDINRHSPDSRGFGARIVPLTGSGNNKSCSVRAKGD